MPCHAGVPLRSVRRAAVWHRIHCTQKVRVKQPCAWPALTLGRCAISFIMLMHIHSCSGCLASRRTQGAAALMAVPHSTLRHARTISSPDVSCGAADCRLQHRCCHTQPIALAAPAGASRARGLCAWPVHHVWRWQVCLSFTFAQGRPGTHAWCWALAHDPAHLADRQHLLHCPVGHVPHCATQR